MRRWTPTRVVFGTGTEGHVTSWNSPSLDPGVSVSSQKLEHRVGHCSPDVSSSGRLRRGSGDRPGPSEAASGIETYSARSPTRLSHRSGVRGLFRLKFLLPSGAGESSSW